jgi:putative spermidine/putrescine transport system substrate-binding protein
VRTAARPRAVAVTIATIALLAAACGGSDGSAEAGDGAGAAASAEADAGAAAGPDPSDWDAVLAEAEGQTVNWYMFGGSDRLNGYIDGYVTEAAAELGITVNQVPVSDTVEAVNTVLGERQAGLDDGGSVDLIWLNGENFLTGKQADLWLCGWAEDTPNSAAHVDWDDPAVASDFGEPVEGCEMPWNRAQSQVILQLGQRAGARLHGRTGGLGGGGDRPGHAARPAGRAGAPRPRR